MKHIDFLKSLKILKGQLEETSKKATLFPSIPHSKTTKVYCTCQDSDGQDKYLYSLKEEMEYLLASKSIKLQSYPCPYEKGWHLTKSMQ